MFPALLSSAFWAHDGRFRGSLTRERKGSRAKVGQSTRELSVGHALCHNGGSGPLAGDDRTRPEGTAEQRLDSGDSVPPYSSVAVKSHGRIGKSPLASVVQFVVFFLNSGAWRRVGDYDLIRGVSRQS